MSNVTPATAGSAAPAGSAGAATSGAAAGTAGAVTAAGSGPAYRRVLLKLSGEALMGEDSYGINRHTIEQMCTQIVEVMRLGVELAIVIGGGNIFRGVSTGAELPQRVLQGQCVHHRGEHAHVVGAQHRADRRALHPAQGPALP